MNVESNNSKSAEGTDDRPPQETIAMLSGREYVIQRNSGSEDGPYVSASEQAHRFTEEILGRGAEVVHLHGSSLGLNFDLTDQERDQFVNDLRGTASAVLRKYAEWVELDSDNAIDESSLPAPAAREVIDLTRP